jgi:hypothetical protein
MGISIAMRTSHGIDLTAEPAAALPHDHDDADFLSAYQDNVSTLKLAI